MKYSFRVRATQTQGQIDSGTFSVVGYDNLDRAIYTGEWKSSLDSGAARVYFRDAQNRNSPTVAELTPGTVTRTFYDRMPARDTLGVELYPATVPADAFRYGRARTVAEVSDVSADGSGNVVRVAKAYSYDKYGRVTATYAYDPTVPADSLRMLALETEYDLGGKVTMVKKYPYGVNGGGSSRKIVERYTYDRLGRVDSLFSKNGGGDEVLLAHYSYYPTGSVKTVIMGNTIILTYTYHISGTVKSATYSANSDGQESNSLYSETLYYEDCGDANCTPQYNGNISRMVHELAHGNADFGQYRDVAYAYDQLNRLTSADDVEQDYFDEIFEYDAQGRMTVQRRDTSIAKNAGGEYAYYANTNRLKSVANGMGGTADDRNMSDVNNFVYDSEGNLIEDKSKKMRITYDWRGMPVEFVREIENGGSLKLVMMYDGNGKRISKAMLRKLTGAAEWSVERTTRYTGIGTEIRTNNSDGKTKVVINMPQGLGRYAIEYADVNDSANAGFEWYLKNHLGSTMAVYRTTGTTAEPPMLQHAYDYRSYGEKINLTVSADKVTENFTGKELDDETELGYWGARYLDLMLGMWISVDPARQFASPYLYAGNGYNPVNVIDSDGNAAEVAYYKGDNSVVITIPVRFDCGGVACSANFSNNEIAAIEKNLTGEFGGYNVNTLVTNEVDGVPTNIFHYVSEDFLFEKFGDTQSHFDMNANEAWINKNSLTPEFSTSHEAGHSVGMRDRYGAQNYLYRHNLMSMPDPTHKEEPLNLKKDQIQEIFESPNNVYTEY